jgi:hypothetical protein
MAKLLTAADIEEMDSRAAVEEVRATLAECDADIANGVALEQAARDRVATRLSSVEFAKRLAAAGKVVDETGIAELDRRVGVSLGKATNAAVVEEAVA